MAPNAPLTCKCRVGRCSACKRCGCEHDGLRIAEKISRKRGHRGAAKTGMRKKLMREANSYKPGNLYESPMVTRATSREAIGSDNYALFSSFASSNPAVMSSRINKVADLLRLFGMEDQIRYLYKHMPSKEKRADPITWKIPTDSSTSVVVNYAGEIAKRICLLLCENCDEAAIALWYLVGRTTTERNETQQHQLFQAVAELYSKAQVHSVEKRVLRACLCNFPLRVLREIKHLVPNFSLSTDGFVKGRRDLTALKEGRRIEKKSRSIQRYAPAIIV